MTPRIKHGKSVLIVIEGGEECVMVGCPALDVHVTAGSLEEAFVEFCKIVTDLVDHYRTKDKDDLLLYGQKVKQTYDDVFGDIP